MGTWLGQARRRNQRLGAIPWDGGTGTPRRLDLRNAGYLERLRLWLNATGTYGTTGPTGTDAFGQYGSLIQRITVLANSVGNLYDLSGEMATVVSFLDDLYETGSSNLPPTQNNFASAPGTAAFAINQYIDVPIAVQLANKPWPLGFFQTALNSQETSLELRFRAFTGSAGLPGSGVYLGGVPAVPTGAAGSVDIQQIYFDPIADPQAQPSLGYIHQWREFQYSLTADGDTDFRMNPSNYYMRILNWIITGGAGALAPDATHLTRLRLQYAANLAPYDETNNNALARMYRDYGIVMPNGLYTEDWLTPTHNERDWINSAATTDLRETITMSGATYSGGAYVKIAVEQLIPLVVPAANTPGVQGAAA